MVLVALLLAVVCLAYANGANDNFKGVATLFGSGASDYRRALGWATATTLLGSLAAVVLARTLLEKFTGQGLVDDALVANADYAAAVALGAGLTVLLATSAGLPVSTTHGLVGSLVGAGFAAGSTINLAQLGGSFFLPLLAGPLLAIVATGLAYPVFRFTRQRLGITANTCLCVGNEIVEIVPASSHAAALERAEQLTVRIGDAVTCRSRYEGQVLGIQAEAAVDRLHFLSAGVVSFARGLNDTPKIAALLLLSPLLGGFSSMALVGVAIAVGGLMSARRVAETMSRKITTLNHGQGFTANLMTGLVVIGASRLGMPVSTTHVSCGALFGLGAVTRQASWVTIARILGAWVITLPLGAALGAASFQILR
ncbi:MAG TPA: inorganic phosphate transporter [Planctomycetaceae bacterium]|nr:inorganic phosphate transporter [Planctomycetaceae bacterium]